MGKVELNTSQATSSSATKQSSPGIVVAARNVDTFTPVYADKSGDQLLQSLNTFYGGAKQTIQANNVLAEQEKKDGMASAMKGEDLQPDASTAFAKGYYQLQGKASLGDLDNQLTSWRESNPDATYEEWTKARNQIVQSSLVGRNNSYLEGFIPGALALEREHDRQVVKLQTKLLQQDVATNAQKVMNNDITRLLSASQKEVSSAVQEMQGQGATQEDIQTRVQGYAVTAAGQFRDVLTRNQALAGKAGMTKLQATKLFVDVMGQKAVSLGRPDLLLFAEAKDPDGIKLVDNPEVSDSIYRYTQQALAAQKTNMQMARTMQREEGKQAADALERILVTDMIDIQSSRSGDPKDAQAKTQALLKKVLAFSDGRKTEANPNGYHIPADKLDSYRKSIMDMMYGDGMNTKTLPDTYASLQPKAWAGQLSWAEVQAHKGELSPSDQTALLKTNLERQSALAGHEEAQDMALFNKAVSSGKDVVGQKDGILGFLDSNSPKRRQMYEYEMASRYQSFRAANADARLTPSEIQKWSDEAEKSVFKTYPQRESKAKPANPEQAKEMASSLIDAVRNK